MSYRVKLKGAIYHNKEGRSSSSNNSSNKQNPYNITMSSALYSVTIDYLDGGNVDVPPVTHPNLPRDAISWHGLTAVVHTSGYTLWTEGELASDGMVQAFRTDDFTLLEQEIDETPFATLAFRDSGAVGANVAGMGSVCSRDQLTVTVTPEHSYVTIFMRMSNTDDWFAGQTLHLYNNGGIGYEGDFVSAVRISAYPLDLGISPQTTFSRGDEWLESQEPVRSFLESATNTSVWGNNTFSYSCGPEVFPVARFHFTKLEPEQDYPDLRVACAIFGSIAFVSLAALVVIGLRHIGCTCWGGKFRQPV